MESFKMPKASLVKVITGTVLAAVIGLIFPVVLTFQLTLLMPLVLLSNLLLPVLFVSGGMIPVAALIISELTCTLFFFGDTVGMMMLAASVFPATAVVMGLSKRRAFFDQLRTGIIAHVIGYLAAIAIAYFSFGGDMISKFINTVREQFALLPDEIVMPAVESVNQMITAMMGGAVSPENLITIDTYRSIVTGTIMDVMQEMYVEYLPGCFLIGAVLTGLLSVLWGNWRMARKGIATSESFVGMSNWNLPPYVAGGVFFIWIVGAVIFSAGTYSSGATAYRTIYMLVQVAFYVQAIASFDRLLIRKYMGLRGRRILIFLTVFGALIIPIINVILFAWGCASAFKGMVLGLKANIHNDNDENKSNDNDNNQ